MSDTEKLKEIVRVIDKVFPGTVVLSGEMEYVFKYGKYDIPLSKYAVMDSSINYVAKYVLLEILDLVMAD